MAKLELLACDKCGATEGTAGFVRETGEVLPDPSGNGYERVVARFDLCPACMAALLRRLPWSLVAGGCNDLGIKYDVR